MKILNFPTPSILTKNPNFLSTLIPKTLNPRNTNPSLFLTLCSTKPPTQNDNTIDENPNPTLQIDSNSINPQPNHPNPISKGLIFDLGTSDSWDSFEVGSPVVKRFLSDDQERWFMWYYGRSNDNTPGSSSGSMGLAVSSNGVHWQRGEKVMNCGENWWAFDTMTIMPSEVMVMSSSKVRISSAVYWLYYTGYTSEEVEFELQNPKNAQIGEFRKVFKSLPGLAISQDGKNWARIEGEHHSGALFDVGSNGDWDSLFISSPHVVFHGAGDLRMYYHSFDLQEKRFAIGVARSRDGIKWVKLGKIECFHEMGVLNPCVVKDKKVGNYLMAYEGVDEDGRGSIGIAVSSDGLKDWRKVSENPGLVSSMEGGWDDNGVGSPCLVQMEGDDDQWRLYYRGVGVKGKSGIGLAISQGSDITSFRRWVGFHL